MIHTAHSLVSPRPNSTQHTSSPRPSCPPLDNPPRVGGTTMVRATIARRSPATCIWCEQITPSQVGSFDLKNHHFCTAVSWNCVEM